MKKQAIYGLVAGLMLSVALPGISQAEIYSRDTHIIIEDTNQLPREFSVLQSGSFDFSQVTQISSSPGNLRLQMINSSDRNVNVRIPELKVSYLVPPNTTRVHELALSDVGYHQEIEYLVETLPSTMIVAVPYERNEALARILSDDYIAMPVFEDEEPVTRANTRQEIRGYW